MRKQLKSIEILEIPISQIEPDPTQVRKSAGDIHSLAMSIKENGVLEPISVYPIGGKRFRILFGERRFKAAKKAGLATIPAIVTTQPKEDRATILQLVENIQRKDLDPIDEAKAIDTLIRHHRLKQEDLAEQLGVAPSNISQTLSILRGIPSDILNELQATGRASKSVLIEIAKAKDAKTKESLLGQLKSGQLTVKNARHRGKYQKRITTFTYNNAGLKIILRQKQSSGVRNETEVLKAAIQTIRDIITERGG